jgi:hypothetical protein
MGIRRAHGRGAAALVRIETLPPDEQPLGLPGDAGPQSRADHDDRGKFADGNKTSVAGGRARAGKTRLAAQLGIKRVAADDAFAPYRRAAARFRAAQCASIAATVGGGQCGPGPSSIVASASLALAASRFLYDTAAGDADLLGKAARLADSSRQALLTASELAAREALARQAANPRAKQQALLDSWKQPVAAVQPPAASDTAQAQGEGGASKNRAISTSDRGTRAPDILCTPEGIEVTASGSPPPADADSSGGAHAVPPDPEGAS